MALTDSPNVAANTSAAPPRKHTTQNAMVPAPNAVRTGRCRGRSSRLCSA